MTYADVQAGVNTTIAYHTGKNSTQIDGTMNIWYILGIGEIEKKFNQGNLVRTGSTHIDNVPLVTNLLTDIGNFFCIQLNWSAGMNTINDIYVAVANILGVTIV